MKCHDRRVAELRAKRTLDWCCSPALLLRLLSFIVSLIGEGIADRVRVYMRDDGGLIVEDLRVSFDGGTVPVIRDLSLRIPAGEGSWPRR